MERLGRLQVGVVSIYLIATDVSGGDCGLDCMLLNVDVFDFSELPVLGQKSALT